MIPVDLMGAGVLPQLESIPAFSVCQGWQLYCPDSWSVVCWIETVRMARPDLVVMGRAGNQRWLVSFGKTREWKASLEKDCVNGVNLAPSAGDFSALLWERGAVSRAGRKTLISQCQQTNLIFCACAEHVPFNVPHSPMGARGR